MSHKNKKTTNARMGARANPTKRPIVIYGMNFSPEPTGVGRYSGELAAYLAQCGEHIEVITAPPHYPGWRVHQGSQNRYRVEREQGIRVHRCPLFLKSEMRGWRFLAALSFAVTSAPIVFWRVLAVRPRTVLCIEPTLLSAPAGLLAAALVGARTLLHVQDLEIDAAFAVGHLKSNWLRQFAIAFERQTLRAFDFIVTISERMAEQLLEKAGGDRRISVIRNWVDLNRIKPLRGPSSYRAELGLTDEFVALYAGNVGRKQALSVMLEAASVLTQVPRIVFVIAGDGPERNSLIELYGHLSNVRFIPLQPEERLNDLLGLADVHVLPQMQGTADLVLPSKLGGMLASGKKSIVMAGPDTELYEFLGAGAILLPVGDSKALADTILRLRNATQSVSLEDNSKRLAALDAQSNLQAWRTILTFPETRPVQQDF